MTREEFKEITEYIGSIINGTSFENHIFPAIGKIKLKDLTLEHIQKAVNKVKLEKVTRNGITSPITGKAVKEIFAPLKQALKYAMADNKMPHISLEFIDMISQKDYFIRKKRSFYSKN